MDFRKFNLRTWPWGGEAAGASAPSLEEWNDWCFYLWDISSMTKSSNNFWVEEPHGFSLCISRHLCWPTFGSFTGFLSRLLRSSTHHAMPVSLSPVALSPELSPQSPDPVNTYLEKKHKENIESNHDFGLSSCFMCFTLFYMVLYACFICKTYHVYCAVLVGCVSYSLRSCFFLLPTADFQGTLQLRRMQPDSSAFCSAADTLTI